MSKCHMIQTEETAFKVHIDVQVAYLAHQVSLPSGTVLAMSGLGTFLRRRLQEFDLSPAFAQRNRKRNMKKIMDVEWLATAGWQPTGAPIHIRHA